MGNEPGRVIMATSKPRNDFIKKFRYWIIFTFKLYECKRVCWARAVMWAEYHENYLFSDLWTGEMDVDKMCLSGNNVCYCGKVEKESNGNNQNPS